MSTVFIWVKKFLCGVDNFSNDTKWDKGYCVHFLVPFLVAMGRSKSRTVGDISVGGLTSVPSDDLVS